jgi:hypothetical protein
MERSSHGTYPTGFELGDRGLLMVKAEVNPIKELLGEMPLSAELFWLFRNRGKPLNSRFSLMNFQQHLPEILTQVKDNRRENQNGKRVLLFASLHYWIEETSLLGLTLAGAGYRPHLAYIPYFDWQKPISKFDLRRNNLYAKEVLAGTQPLLLITSLLDYPKKQKLPAELLKDIETVSYYDAQYTLQVETVDKESDIYKMRLQRNIFAAERFFALLDDAKPDAVIVPNGTIQELGAAYRVAKFTGVPVATFEFSDQKDCIWMAQNAEIMRQDTTKIWETRKDKPLTEQQRTRIEALYKAKVQGDLFENFVRHWQASKREGANEVKQTLKLDNRPIILLATNVLGDSLTLGRQVFSKTMAEWIERSVEYFAKRNDIQLVIRIHPGEILTHGPSMVDVVKNILPHLPEHIHLIGPREKVNTYDLIEMADLGLVYTTTTGMEMAMSGVPVVVAGVTHYKNNGFTFDPQTYPEYFELLDKMLMQPELYLLNKEQVELAWRYAYTFFFEFSLPFPWRLFKLWEDVKDRPVSYVLGEGYTKYEKTFRYLSGDPIEW